MKIKHYPGKAVANDPYLLDMEARNPAMDLLYQASWLDAQRSLSSSSSGSNSWDRHSSSSTERQLHKYNTLQERRDNKGSIRSRKYHSDQYLSRIASQRTKIKVIDMDSSMDDYQTYYLPSQTKNIRQHKDSDLQDNESIHRISKIYSTPQIIENLNDDLTRLNLENKPCNKYNDINDLEVQLIKKSVRFHDKSEEIGVQDAQSSQSSKSSRYEKMCWDDNETSLNKRNSIEHKVRVVENPLDSYNIYKTTTVDLADNQISVNIERRNSEEVINERVNEWINEQNQYLVNRNNDSTQLDNCKTKTQYKPQPTPRTKTNNNQPQKEPQNGLYTSRIKPQNQTDEEFYDKLVNSRQRLPAEKNGFNKKNSSPHYENEEAILNLAKEILQNKRNDLINDSVSENCSDFLIPRPKLIVPVHTYAVRKRRTGNLQSRKSLCDNGEKEAMPRDTNADGEILYFYLTLVFFIQ